MELPIGIACSYLALMFGGIYFIYALKYYTATIIALNTIPHQNMDPPETLNDSSYFDSLFTEWDPQEEPFISIHLPFYNEANVAKRIIQACIDLDYTNYEVMIADDSRDETIQVMKNTDYRTTNPIIKFVHRKDRSGFKGGALQQALQYMHPKAQYIVVFDADFVPPSRILREFISHFKKTHQDEKPVAVVQGYQLHHLNKNENWVTRGVRAEFSGSYMVERVAEEVLGAMKMISGSVFMLRADLIRDLGWTNSITEDWELTLRVYLEGYKVVYTPLIQAPAEIPTTVTRLIKQRMRWAEGHTFAVRRYFKQVITSDKLTLGEKLEFVYFAPYYLQSFFFLIGTACWIISELLRQYPRWWRPEFGWGLIVSNFFAIPLMSAAGLFLEGDLREDYSGIFSFIAISYILTPYQAYAALKGLLEGEEGSWIRTLKTGHITDTVFGVKLRSFIRWFKSLGDTKSKIVSREPESYRPMIMVPVRQLLVFMCIALILLPFSKTWIELITQITPWVITVINNLSGKI